MSSHNPSYRDTSTEYYLPNDSTEHARLEEQSAGLNELMHKQPFHAARLFPSTSPPRRILDIGCGTGIMTVALAQKYPAATVYGVDLSSVPTLHNKPENVIFVQGDIKDLIRNKPGNDEDRDDNHNPRLFHPTSSITGTSIDYAFSRLLVCGMSAWPTYLTTLFSTLSPGAYAELHDLDYKWYKTPSNTNSGPPTRIDQDWNWSVALRHAAAAKKMDLDCGSKMAGWMRDAGFVDVQVWKYRWAYGEGWVGRQGFPEGERLARFTGREMWRLFDGLVPRMLRGVMVVEEEEPGGRRGGGGGGGGGQRVRQVFGDEEIEECRREAVRCLGPEEGKYYVLFVTVGKKPEAAAV